MMKGRARDAETMRPPPNGETPAECAYCGTQGFANRIVGTREVDGIACLGGYMIGGRLRGLCAGCVRGANAMFARLVKAKCA